MKRFEQAFVVLLFGWLIFRLVTFGEALIGFSIIMILIILGIIHVGLEFSYEKITSKNGLTFGAVLISSAIIGYRVTFGIDHAYDPSTWREVGLLLTQRLHTVLFMFGAVFISLCAALSLYLRNSRR